VSAGRRLTRVAVLMGGPSSEHDVSIASGRNVVRLLDHARFEVLPVVVGRDGRFAFGDTRGEEEPSRGSRAAAAAEALARLAAWPADVAFLAMHGPFGEDGTIQGFLDVAGIPYTGSGVAASALAMDKSNARHVLSGNGVPVAKGLTLSRLGDAVLPKDAVGSIARRAREAIGVPCVVKPNAMGSSVGVSIVRRADDLDAALATAFEGSTRVLVEEFVSGVELTCGVLGNSGDGHAMALPPTEIRAPEGRFFDYDVKYRAGAALELTPAPIDPGLARHVQDLALRAHECLGCRGLSRTDFRVRDGGAPVALEVNTLPGMTETSLLPQAAAAAGIPFPELLTRLVEYALSGRGADAA
jgi:D-alanine-D-alanine ligase